jgi:hypothetical protein
MGSAALPRGATSTTPTTPTTPTPATVLDVSFDRTQVNDGDTVNVTVELTATPTSTTGGKAHERFAIVSTGSDGRSHAWPTIVYAEEPRGSGVAIPALSLASRRV